MRTPAEKRAAFMPQVVIVLNRLEDDLVVAILAAAIHRRFVAVGSPAVSPDVHVADTPEALDVPPTTNDERPDLGVLAHDAEGLLTEFAATLPEEEQPEFFLGVEEAATEVLRNRGLAVRLTPYQ